MWPTNYADRLQQWHRLRQECCQLNLASALEQINRWWWQAPWIANGLNWQDQSDWPDPWQLLDQNRVCDLARALGMSYTVIMLSRPDIEDAWLVQCGYVDLVTVQANKYILNWCADTIVNITPDEQHPHRRISMQQLESRIN